MAKRCATGGCPYGYGHHDEHVEAARLGWRRRRQGEARYVEKAFKGYRLHTHTPDHPFGKTRYIIQEEATGEHFELEPHEYRDLIREQRSMERASTIQKSLFDRENNARLRAEQAGQRRAFREQQRHEREATRLAREQEREAEREQRRAARYERDALYGSLAEYLPTGIKPYKSGQEREEYENVPRYFRASRRSGEGLTLDDAALQLSENAPWLGIHSADDLTQAFSRVKLSASNEKYRRQRSA